MLWQDDFRSDKANLHLGSAFEMIALCSFLTETDGR